MLTDEQRPSALKLREMFDYEPDTGILHWKVGSGTNFVTSRSMAGGPDSRGYTRIKIDGREYLAHMMAWAIHYGEWPDMQIDHIDGNRSNNRILNLRLATGSQNSSNIGISPSNTSGYKGVYRDKKTGKWIARIKVRGKFIYLGTRESPHEAAHEYNKGAIQHHGEFARLNIPGIPYVAATHMEKAA
jgi:hypothetical protein